ncbi:hypothetical protein Pse7367_0183 [Thalassoporum mexicanum PCC 7367]|nr:hypothetical protein Pse7367_0183 [Pseudanabaena sp. PCC 7367]
MAMALILMMTYPYWKSDLINPNMALNIDPNIDQIANRLAKLERSPAKYVLKA